MARAAKPITIKRYGGQRYYDPAALAYLSCDDIAALARRGHPIAVIDAASGEDVTDSVLPILVEC